MYHVFIVFFNLMFVISVMSMECQFQNSDQKKLSGYQEEYLKILNDLYGLSEIRYNGLDRCNKLLNDLDGVIKSTSDLYIKLDREQNKSEDIVQIRNCINVLIIVLDKVDARMQSQTEDDNVKITAFSKAIKKIITWIRTDIEMSPNQQNIL